jgi:Raf kinase inhibitor-like YbhB/YbcL family protein
LAARILTALVAAGLISLPVAGSAERPAEGGAMPLILSSSGFTEGATIPPRFTCDGENVPPPIQWDGKPSSAKSLVLILDDPDAPGGVFTHWIVYDLPAADVDSGRIVSGMAHEGKNDFGRTGYGGPCPPRGHGAHRYFFTLSAVDVASLGLPAGASRQQVDAKLRGHVIATAKLMGKYERK